MGTKSTTSGKQAVFTNIKPVENSNYVVDSIYVKGGYFTIKNMSELTKRLYTYNEDGTTTCTADLTINEGSLFYCIEEATIKTTNYPKGFYLCTAVNVNEQTR